jgi:hypothetical protein
MRFGNLPEYEDFPWLTKEQIGDAGGDPGGVTFKSDVLEPGPVESSSGLWILIAIIAALIFLPAKKKTGELVS